MKLGDLTSGHCESGPFLCTVGVLLLGAASFVLFRSAYAQWHEAQGKPTTKI